MEDGKEEILLTRESVKLVGFGLTRLRFGRSQGRFPLGNDVEGENERKDGLHTFRDGLDLGEADHPR